MASESRTDAEGDVKLKKEMCMSSLKRALDDVEYSGCGSEPLKKKTHLPGPKRHIRGSTVGRKINPVNCTRKVQRPKKLFQKAPQKQSAKSLPHSVSPEGSFGVHKIKTTGFTGKNRQSKRSAEMSQSFLTEESDPKKRRLEQTTLEIGTSNGVDSPGTSDEFSPTDEFLSTPQPYDYTKLVPPVCGIPEYPVEGNKNFHNPVQLSYTFRKNVAFARKIVVYSSDGSEYDYDYSDADGSVDNDDDNDNNEDVSGDDYNYEDIDPDVEVVSKRLNLEIADFFENHRTRGQSIFKSKIKLAPQCLEEPHIECKHGCSSLQDSQAKSFGRGLLHKQPIDTAHRTLPGEPADSAVVARVSESAAGVSAGAAAAFGHDENGNDADEFDRTSAASAHLLH